MGNGHATPVVRQLRRLAAASAQRLRSDGELVTRFAERQDEAAFETLVQRHGGMVFGVCRRVLHHEHDAEDAFQATWLVFARKASSIRRQQSVSCWLHGVAHRLALQAKTAAARRRQREAHGRRQLAEVSLPKMTWEEIAPVLDVELERMPDRLRAPLVLCYLESMTRDEAARRLGWSLRTLMRRLEQGRTRLRARLTRRGVTMAAALLTSSLAPSAASAGAPTALVQSTIQAALLFAAGSPAGAVVSAEVTVLIKEALHAMLISKLKISALVLAVVVSLGSAALWTRLPASAASDPAPQKVGGNRARAPFQAASQPKVQQGPNKLLFYRAGTLVLIGPDGKDEKAASKPGSGFHPSGHSLSPDGKRVASLVQIDQEPAVGRDPRRKVYLRGIDEPDPGTDLEVEGQQAVWSPDGSQLVAVEFVVGENRKDTKIVNWLVNVTTKEKTALKLPDNHIVEDWSRDGKHFLTTAIDMQKMPPSARLFLMNKDGSEARALTDAKQSAFRGKLSPDGRKVLYQAPDPERKGRDRFTSHGLFVLDMQSGKSSRIEQQPLNGEMMSFCWSPDGKRIAYVWRQLHDQPGANLATESQLVVADADGNNPAPIATERAPNAGTITIGWVNWR